MDFTIKATMLATYYPLQQRVNMIMQDMGLINPYIIFFGGMNGFVNTVLTRPTLKDKINSFDTDKVEDMYLQLTDVELSQAVQQAWDLAGSFISSPVLQAPMSNTPTGPTGN